MGVSIENLTRSFGDQLAVDQVSFEAKKGVITGFLGPNGAGKSTTMKMATGFLRPTSGRVVLEGMDIATQAHAAKSIIGYLPEHNPMYLEMYVREFLQFIAGAYRLKNAKLKVEEMIELVGLTRERNKKIGSLSKGYRQRVGLAKALIHNPKVLILDEPTSGLDPNQIVEIRQVIKNMSLDKTVILSTHIMQEVEAICDQVVIIDQGKLVANDKLSVLKEGLKADHGILVTFDLDIDVQLFTAEGLAIDHQEGHVYLVSADRSDLRAEVLRITSKHDLPLQSLTKAEQSLEQIFHRLTQKETL